MRNLRILLVDLALVSIALVAAMVLRANLEFSGDQFVNLLPYWFFTVVTAAVVLPLLGVTVAVWRYSSMRNYLDIVAASAVIVGGALVSTFIANRLDGVPRALPVLQGMLMIGLLVSARISSRLWHARWSQRSRMANAVAPAGNTVLIIGVSKLAELYLHCIADYASDRVHVVGLLDRYASFGLSLLSQRVLGAPEQVDDVLRDLEVHGIFVDRIVVAVPLNELSSQARRALLAIEASRSIPLDFLDQKIGLAHRIGTGAAPDSASGSQMQACRIDPPAAGASLSKSRYSTIKRLLDIACAALLLVACAPIMALVAVVVAFDVGFPVLFWQQRPGRGGRPFKVYKFRTMGEAHDALGRRRPDAQRISPIGRFLRRTRLDELPQLPGILMGDMSFVGPRPLLPVDQPADYSARLLVRPGLTGWAQIKGGRAISAIDKAALDVWYVKNVSFILDVRIVLGTIPMILFGERVQNEAIAQAWQELGESRPS